MESNAHGPPPENSRFQSISLHAQGGIGSVFLARDDELNRLVALKEIQPRFADDPGSRDRFLREAEVTARLEHPGIVPIYGFGQYADGRPYYAMRMIQGKSLREAIVDLHQNHKSDEHAFALDLRKLLGRLITVCNTIEYAHSKGVLHRDLKPENIMLGPYGETLVVDWGLAKILERSHAASADAAESHISPKLHDTSVADSRLQHVSATQAGTIIGTPAYMSPEQALGWHDALTPSSDVYSLGAMLYALLTGNAPDVGRDFATILTRIRNQQFPKPRELNAGVAAPLEAICLKAMSPIGTRRYHSAAELASDLESYLADEPVTAWREPRRVRFARWMRRHRTFVTSAAGVGAATLLALGVIVTLQKAANVRLTESRDREKQHFDMAREAVDRYFTQVSEDPRLAAAGLEPLRRELLQTAGNFYERFARQEAASPELPYELGWAKFRLASITEEIGSASAAAEQLEQADEHFRSLIAQDGTNSAYREGLLFCRLNLANLYDRMNRTAEAERSIDESIELATALAAAHPENAAFQNDLARCYSARAGRFVARGSLAEATEAYRQELTVREKIVREHASHARYRLDLATMLRNLAVLDQRQNKLDEARKNLTRSIEIERHLIREAPHSGPFADGLARSLTLLGDVERAEGRSGPARDAYDEAIRIRTELVGRHPDVLEYRARLAEASNHLGSLQYERGELDAADAQFRSALANAERLAGDYPSQHEYQSLVAQSAVNWGMLCAATNRLPSAEELLLRAERIRIELRKDSAATDEQNVSLGGIWRELAGIESKSGRVANADRHLRAAIDVLEKLTVAHPDVPQHFDKLAATYRDLGDLLRSSEQSDAAAAEYRRAELLQRKLVETHATVFSYRVSLATTLTQTADLLGAQQKPEEALARFREALELFAGRDDTSLNYAERSVLRNAHAGRALLWEASGATAEAIDDIERAIHYAPKDEVAGLRLKRATLLSRAGRSGDAVTEAESLATEAEGYGPALVELARIYAVAADSSREGEEAKPDKLKEVWISRAVALLTSAHRAGYFADASSQALLKQEVFARTLAADPDYKKLLSEFEKPPAGSASRPSDSP